MNTASPLAAEREYIKLDRSRQNAAIAAAVAVAALDTQIERGPMPTVLDEHEDFITPGWTLFKLPVGGVTAHVPTRTLTPLVRAKLYDLMRAVEAELR